MGQNLVVLRPSLGEDRLPDAATELVRARVDVIVAEGTAAVRAAKRATETTPIVMVIGGDPVASGLVASLARPGGNVTGVTFLSLELVVKRLQLLKEVVPRATRVAVLWNASSPEKELEWAALQVAAPRLGVTLQSVDVHREQDFEPALGRAVSQRPDALVVLADSLTVAYAATIADLAKKHRLPAIYGWGAHARTAWGSGLMAYGPDLFDLAASTATYVDRILKGAKPADLPVQQPTRFELVVNLGAAKAIGLTIPQAILARADKVFE